MNKIVAIAMTMGAAALYCAAPANADTVRAASGVTKASDAATDVSARRRHYRVIRHHHRGHYFAPRYAYAPIYYARPVYYAPAPIVSFGFGFGGGRHIYRGHRHW